jgi:probable F420-dependent oxidoreductase
VARPFKFAIQATRAESASEWRNLVRRTEDLGYSTLFHADHYVGPGPASSRSLLGAQYLAPIASMAAAASWTSTLLIGCRVFCIDYHVPAVLAKEAATIDLLSDGRLVFGIGAGWHADEYEAMGLSFADGPRRIDKLEEVVALIKAHWSGEQIDPTGDYGRASGYSGLPVPVQKPHPPIMIGGSKKRVLSFAARQADIVSINNVAWADPAPFDEVRRRLDYVRAAAGDRFDQLEIETSPSYTEVTEDVEGTLLRIGPTLRNADPHMLRTHPNVLVGSVSEMIDRLQALRETIAVNYVTVPSDQVETFAPVVSRLAGL